MFHEVTSSAASPDSLPTSQNTSQPLHFARIVIFIPSIQEFGWERRALLNEVIPDVQQYAFQSGVDVEFLLSTCEGLHEFIEIEDILRRSASYLMCLFGNKYGEIMPPLGLNSDQFNLLRAAAVETCKDMKIIEKHYLLDRTRNPSEYRLQLQKMSNDDIRNLTDIFQCAANQVADDCSNSQADTTCQNYYYESINGMILNLASRFVKKSILILRNIEGVKYNDENSDWIDADDRNRQKVKELKKKIASSDVKKIIFNVNPDSCHVETWFGSRSHDKYIENFVHQCSDCLKSSINLFSPTNSTPPSSVEIANAENDIHTEFANSQCPQKWLQRSNLDEMIEKWINEANKSTYVHIYGNNATGKTALICRIASLLRDRSYYVITRFINLTPSSNFAHELWHGISMILCLFLGQDTTPLQSSFHLSSTFSILKSLLKKVNRPLFVLMDDAHLIKFGRALSILDKPFRKFLPNLILIATSLSPSPIPFLPQSENFELPSFKCSEIVDYLNNYVSSVSRKISADQMRQIVNKNREEMNIVTARWQTDQFLINGTLDTSIDQFLTSLEETFGLNYIREFVQFLSVTPNGLTTLELIDVFNLNAEISSAFDMQLIPPFFIYSIIKKFGCLILEFVSGNRLVYKWSHNFIASTLRHRYLTNTADLKQAHSLLADLFADVAVESGCSSARSHNVTNIFPRALRRDSGAANVRKINNLWYHLLHTGNMDTLKELSLCYFDYIDACMRYCGLPQLLSIYEECSMQVLHHDIQVLCEQVLLPSLNTIIRDSDQFAAELIGRLRYTRAENSHFLNTMVEQAMAWVDMYSEQPLLVPLTCWINPPKMRQVLSFFLSEWKSTRTVLQPTHNHQHVLLSGNELAPGLIYMYHIASQLLIRTFAGHTDRVTSLSINPNGQFFISTSYDGTLRIWLFSKTDAVSVLRPHKGKITCSLVTSDSKYIVTGGTDSFAHVISVESELIIRSFGDHTGSVVSVAISSCDEFLITGSGDFVVSIWNLLSGELAVRLGGLMAPVTCITITSNDAFVIVACEDETLRVFATVSGQELHELSGHEGKVLSVAAAQDDCQLFAACISKIYLYDIHNGMLLDTLDCVHKQPVTSLKITSDNYFLLSACGDRIDVWNIFRQPHDLDEANKNELQGIVMAIILSRDEKSAACSTKNGSVALWDLEICQCIWTMVQKKDVPVTCLRFTFDSVFLISGDCDGQINLWDTSDGSLVRTIKLHTVEIVSIYCFTDDQRAISADISDLLHVWNILLVDETQESEAILSLSGIRPPIFLSPNGTHLIGRHPNNNKEMRIWTIVEEIVSAKTKIYHNDEITCYSTTTSGSLLITGSVDQSLKIWQIDTGFLIQVLVGHESSVLCCAVAEDERLVVSGGKDSQIIVWDVTTGDAHLSLSTTAPLSAICLTIDGTVAFSADETGWMAAHETLHGKLISTFNAHRSAKFLISSADGNRILALFSNCAQLPILCLHNTPAGTLVNRPTENRRPNTRALSVSSIGSNSSENKPTIQSSSPTANTLAAPNGMKTSKTFDKIERSRPKTSSTDKERTTVYTTKPTITSSVNKSALCVLL